MSSTQKKVAQLQLEEACQYGDFVAPSAFEISGIDVLKEEQFGPILHIVRFKASELPNVVEQINQTGFGLTMGIHSRNETTYRWIEKHARVGNCYINRDQVGAVVGVQPFGGQGLSGTGPKLVVLTTCTALHNIFLLKQRTHKESHYGSSDHIF